MISIQVGDTLHISIEKTDYTNSTHSTSSKYSYTHHQYIVYNLVTWVPDNSNNIHEMSPLLFKLSTASLIICSI